MKNIFLISILFVGFIYSFFLSLFIPIYGDEFDWRLISSRLFVDHQLVWVFPSCLKGFWLEAPITWYPYLFFEGLIYQGAHDLRLLRLFGCVIFLIILYLNAKILKTLSGLGFPVCLLVVTSFFSLGVLPFSMVLNRPEQELNLLVCIAIALAITLKKGNSEFDRTPRKILLLGVFSLIVIFMLGAHPKSIFFLPIIASSYWLVSKSKKYTFVFLMICVVTAYQTIRLWGARTLCEENTWLSFRNLTLSPGQIFQDPFKFIEMFGTNLKSSFLYIKYIYIQDQYQSNWPAIDPEFQVTLSGSLFLVANISIFAMAIISFNFFILGIRRIASRKNYDYSLIFISITVSIILLSGMQSGKNFYEANWFWVLIFLLFIFSIDFNNSLIRKIFKHYIVPLFVIFGLLSSAVRIVQFYPSLTSWQMAAKSYSLANSLNHKKQLKEFARDRCDINQFATGLVLETLTYPSFWEHPKPYFITFLTGWWGTGTNYPELIRNAHSGGMILQCPNIPPEYLKYTKRNDQNFCCVSSADIYKVRGIKN
jgi:hypothetical protein